ncbi:uncharacterized protein HMPREF1541_06179 [Cyphellophora europaea CBS 101466]|uniref:Zn(2)-C6 fungal-type domain-containing protein n=1 Tax=Cyphellophora europaea (strain CBS 101466) TaxID=1220924 RepID=W2RU52_CYPE1|nr:uncharacterized protein HMPREF1541_06179 [Cyphellophora europaea CBS 101466]ETN39952.1 hypothetical protein HMPREF1541_06179 [Cyphellophora europaea CBS 101466]
MDVDPPHLRSSRVKACTECRQQKLRCDAGQSSSTGCSRCRRRGLKCVITSNFVRSKRKTKSELQAELASLKDQLQSPTHPSPGQPPSHVRVSSNSDQAIASPMEQRVHSASTEAFQQQPTREISSVPTQDSTSWSTLPRVFGDVEVSALAINDCFRIFFTRYWPQCPAIEGEISPNDCYSQSQYLFWTITTIGSRRYIRDPTLLSQLAPQLINSTKHAAFSREKSLHTIQAFVLHCAWPLPYNSLSKDITHILSGMLVQHALSVGLHIFGVGQDFSRIKLQNDRAMMYLRARLWVLCIVVCQRISCTDGVPPMYIPDNYDHESHQAQSIYALPPALRFQKTLSRILTESILELERYALSKAMPHRAAVLNPIIDAASLSLAELEPECPGEIERYYLICAELQIVAFHLLGPKGSFQESKIIKMHELACSAIDILDNLDSVQSWAVDAPSNALKYLTLAGFTLLKLSRCHMRDRLDLAQGKMAYFTAMAIFKKAAVETDDSIGRLPKIMTQLWTSKNIFKKADGSTDALSLRCGSRLAMSIVYDCYWWWRSEFAGMPNPYEERDHNTLEEQLTPETFQNMVWLQESFPEFAWPTMQDLASLEWTPQSAAAPSTFPAPGSAMPDLSTIWA